MRFANGINTIYNGYRLRYLIDGNKTTLLSDDLPIEGFRKYSDQVFEKKVATSEITNSFSYIVKCRKNGYVLKVFIFVGDDKLIAYSNHRPTIDTLQLECVEKGGYEKEFLISELDAIWEERSEGYDGLPYPEGLPRIEYIKGGPEV